MKKLIFFQSQAILPNEFWSEYWADWVNIGVIHSNDSILEHAPDSEEAEIRFLSLLHRVFRSGNHLNDNLHN